MEYGTLKVDLGNITVTDSQGFAVGKNLEVTIDYTAFTAEGVETSIPVQLVKIGKKTNYSDLSQNVQSGDIITFEGQSNGTVSTNSTSIVDTAGNVFVVNTFMARMSSADWGKALPGDYTSTITFTSEVVVDE